MYTLLCIHSFIYWNFIYLYDIIILSITMFYICKKKKIIIKQKINSTILINRKYPSTHVYILHTNIYIYNKIQY